MAVLTKNKRHGPDPIIRGKKLMIALAWIFILLIIIMFGYAEPHTNLRIYTGTGGPSGGQPWDRAMLRYAYLLMFPLAITSAIGLVFNSWRNNRKYDFYSKTLIVSMLFSILGILFFSIFFFIS